MSDDNMITDPSHVHFLSRELRKTWRCPKCGNVIPRKILRPADGGDYPDEYNYILYESDGDFTLRIINHLATHIYI